MMGKARPKHEELRLPEVLDAGVAAELALQLQKLRGRAVTLNAADVRRVGGLSLQVLLSARLTWANDDASLNVAAPSAAFQEALTLYGATSLIEPGAA